MAQIKALLGHASVQTAARTRACWRHRNRKHEHDIVKGEMCLVIKDYDGTNANYCLAAATDILDRA
jgi:hypothetical protein